MKKLFLLFLFVFSFICVINIDFVYSELPEYEFSFEWGYNVDYTQPDFYRLYVRTNDNQYDYNNWAYEGEKKDCTIHVPYGFSSYRFVVAAFYNNSEKGPNSTEIEYLVESELGDPEDLEEAEEETPNNKIYGARLYVDKIGNEYFEWERQPEPGVYILNRHEKGYYVQVVEKPIILPEEVKVYYSLNNSKTIVHQCIEGGKCCRYFKMDNAILELPQCLFLNEDDPKKCRMCKICEHYNDK